MTDTPHRLTQAWRTLDFMPAPPGWRVIFLNASGRQVIPMAGWLVQESCLYDHAEDQVHDDESPERRVIPGTCTHAYGWIVEPVDLDEEFLWTVLAPGVPEPTEEEEAAEQARKAEDRRQRRG